MAASRKDPPGDDSPASAKKRRTSDRLNVAPSSSGEPIALDGPSSDSQKEPSSGALEQRAVPAVDQELPSIPAESTEPSSPTVTPSPPHEGDGVGDESRQGSEPVASIRTPPSTPRTKRGTGTLASPFALRSSSGSPSSPSGPATMRASASELEVRAPRHIPYGIRHFASDEVVDRINRAMAYRQHQPITYAVSVFPKTFQWGPPTVKGRKDVPDTDDLSGYVTQGTQMVRVMIIGELCSAFLTGNANNGGTASIRVKPLLLSDGLRMDDLVEGFSTSSRARLGESNTKGTYMSAKIGEGSIFARVFDAREGFVGKKLMPTLSARDLRNKDLVYAEAYVQRYWFKSDGKCKYLPGHEGCLDWTSTPYRIGLELVAISLVASHYALDEDEAEVPAGM